MPLMLPVPPESIYAIASSLIHEHTATNRLGPHLVLGEGDNLSLAMPHQVYTLSLTDIASDSTLNNASTTEWQILLLSDNNGLGVLGFQTGDHGYEIAQVSYGQYVQDIILAIQEAEEAYGKEDQEYEVRLLRFPPVNVMSVWLHDSSCTHDVFIPLPPVPSRLEAFLSYNLDDFISIIKMLSENRSSDALDY